MIWLYLMGGAMLLALAGPSIPGLWLGTMWLAVVGVAAYKIAEALGFLGQKTGALHDVRENAGMMAALKQPFTLPAKTGAVTVGAVRISKKKIDPVVLPPEVWHKNHASILGASGTGKSKLAAQVLTQLNQHGDAVVVLDPKDDEFLPGIMAAQAAKTGLPFVLVNLRDSTPQINPLAGATPEQIAQLIEVALNLDPTGDPAVDFFRGEDRAGVAAMVASGSTDIPSLAGAGAELKACTSKQNFWREMLILSTVGAFQTAADLELEQVIQAGGVIYVIGDTDDLRIVAAQRLMLARILQIIKARARADARQVCLFLDEFKYLLSNVALRALGTIRDRRCNLILAYQSYGDLEDCGTLKPAAVLGAAKGNTTLKFVYKLEDVRTAEDFVKIAGQTRQMVESTNKIDFEGQEAGNWREANVDAISVDMLTTNAPKPMAGEASVCWVFGIGPAFPLSTMHLPAGPSPTIKPQPKVTGPATVGDVQTSDDLI